MKRLKIVLLVFVGVLVVGVGIFIYLFNPFTIPTQENVPIPPYSDPKCSRTFLPQLSTGPYYMGPLFDTHYHLPPTFKHKERSNEFPTLEKEIPIKDLICELEKEKIVGTLAFYFPNFWQLESDTSLSKEEILRNWAGEAGKIREALPGWMHMLFTPGPLNGAEVADVYNLSAGVFEGFGEIVYFFPGSPRLFSKVDDAVSLEIDKIANDKKQIVMLHPGVSQRKRLEKVLSMYPNVNFVLHGWERDDYLWKLFEKYPNMYFTLDAATLYPIFGKIDGSEKNFLPSFTKNFNKILDKDITKWKAQIERYPGRFMWERIDTLTGIIIWRRACCSKNLPGLLSVGLIRKFRKILPIKMRKTCFWVSEILAVQEVRLPV